ncbi:hypothetical protein [Mesorhizobium sp.]|uniref:hypothetical protein n=1 Tax=Mesorhizobium sp. TaxID=1871066 RepID=UPI000FE596E6|nr:hypothetical protein [Mesorhizobium sp.]RWK11069.1 MAG: hypothetical protein EOR39_12195 [Mesorhizobium sp.]TIQ44810.1 MAG: hypothetical protein E5X47_28075 [Mesorhizobium sp.]TIQ59516.1 MAG: hypothetical protein E5X46_06045 [Mesorhizobium sp.]TJV92582.1 MAG: hypothetical protein E5X52_33300 [Mesorhizobium sp.]
MGESNHVGSLEHLRFDRIGSVVNKVIGVRAYDYDVTMTSAPFSHPPSFEVITLAQRQPRWTTAEKVSRVEESCSPACQCTAPSRHFAQPALALGAVHAGRRRDRGSGR